MSTTANSDGAALASSIWAAQQLMADDDQMITDQQIEQALEGLQAVHNDDMETMIIGNLAQHNCVAEVYDRSESDPSITLFIDLGWPLNGDLIVTMRYDGYGTDSGAFVIDDWYTR